jgi:hypothetical protein
MARSCPECGGAVEYQSRSVEVLEGACAACGRAVVVLPSAASGASAAERAAASSAAPPAPCWECGGPLTLTILPGPAIDAHCDACDTTTRLAIVPSGGGSFRSEEGRPEESEEEEEDEEGAGEESPRPGRALPRGPRGRPPRGPERPRFGGGGEERSFRPNARPCRQCGGPLDFDTNEDGSVTGRCRSCGNTFTMRPREEQRPRSFDRRPGWGGRPGGPRYSSGPRRPYQGNRDDDRPRRRRRRED